MLKAVPEKLYLQRLTLSDRGNLYDPGEYPLRNIVRLCVLAFSALGVVSTTPALASTDYFTLTDSTIPAVYTFSLPSSPSPWTTYPTFGVTIFNNLSYTVNGTPETGGYVGFYDTSGGGGLAIQDSSLNILDATYGAQVFTGTLNAPTFVPGDYTQYDVTGAPVGTLVISADPAPTPEPSSIALLGTGALGLVSVVRRRLNR